MKDRKLAENLLNIAPKINSKLCDYWDYKTLAETTILFMANINKEKDSYEFLKTLKILLLKCLINGREY